MAALNLFPARVPIGKAAARDGSTMDVLMTVEFSRALAAVLERVGGPDGVSNTELSKRIKELQQQAVLLVQQITELFERAAALAAALEDQAIMDATTPDIVGPDIFDAVQLLGLGRAVTNIGARLDDLALEQAAPAAAPALAQQLADLNMMLALQEKPPLQRNIVTGAKGGNAALTSLLAALAKSGIITDLTT